MKLVRSFELVNQDNVNDVVENLAVFGYYSPLPFDGKLPKHRGDIFIQSYFNNWNRKYEWNFVTRKTVPEKIPYGVKHYEVYESLHLDGLYEKGRIDISLEVGEIDSNSVLEKELTSDDLTIELSDKPFSLSVLEALLLTEVEETEIEKDREFLSYLANELSITGHVSVQFDFKDKRMRVSLKKTPLFSKTNESGTRLLRPSVYDGYGYQLLDFSYSYDNFVYQIADKLGISTKEAEQKNVFIQLCDLKTKAAIGEVDSSFETPKKAFEAYKK